MEIELAVLPLKRTVLILKESSVPSQAASLKAEYVMVVGLEPLNVAQSEPIPGPVTIAAFAEPATAAAAAIPTIEEMKVLFRI
jgi:hypothetical protein